MVICVGSLWFLSVGVTCSQTGRSALLILKTWIRWSEQGPKADLQGKLHSEQMFTAPLENTSLNPRTITHITWEWQDGVAEAVRPQSGLPEDWAQKRRWRKPCVFWEEMQVESTGVRERTVAGEEMTLGWEFEASDDGTNSLRRPDKKPFAPHWN